MKGFKWTKEDKKLIEKLKNPVKKPDKKEAKRVWDTGVAIPFFKTFEDYWKEVKNCKVMERRCERCKYYPCASLKRLVKKYRVLVITWIYHGTACSEFINVRN